MSNSVDQVDSIVLGKFRPLTNETTIAVDKDTRAIKCNYKGKDTNNAYVVIPTEHLSATNIVSARDILDPYVVQWLQSQEDAMIKADHKKGLLSVATEYLSLDKIIAYMEKVNPLVKLTKDQVIEWFDTYVKDEIISRLVKNDIIAADKQAPYLVQYRDKFVAIIGSRTRIEEQDKVVLKELIEFCTDDEIATSLLNLLDKKSTEADLLMTL